MRGQADLQALSDKKPICGARGPCRLAGRSKADAKGGMVKLPRFVVVSGAWQIKEWREEEMGARIHYSNSLEEVLRITVDNLPDVYLLACSWKEWNACRSYRISSKISICIASPSNQRKTQAEPLLTPPGEKTPTTSNKRVKSALNA